MSLILLDSFDHYATAQMTKKWSERQGGSISASTSRTGLQSFDFSSSSGPRLLLSAVDEHATLIVGFAFYTTDYLSPAFAPLFYLQSDDCQTTHLQVEISGFGRLQVTRAGGGLLGSSANTRIYLNTWHYIEFKATLHDTTGAIELRVDNLSVLNVSGIDTKNAGTKSVFDAIWFGVSGWMNYAFIDDFYLCNGAGSVCNDFLGDLSVQTLLPSAAGNSTGLAPTSGANYTTVDDPQMNTTDYVSSSVAATKDTYIFPDIATPRTIKAVQASHYGVKTDGSRLLVPVVRSGGTDYDGSGQLLSQDWKLHRTIYQTNPATSAAWTDSGLNAAEFGVKVG